MCRTLLESALGKLYVTFRGTELISISRVWHAQQRECRTGHRLSLQVACESRGQSGLQCQEVLRARCVGFFTRPGTIASCSPDAALSAGYEWR